ncbi:MAG TPA: PDZ domain-containing protein [Bryobacteraceae bacterium]|jgi:serine protease Do|nr:PDZ domain-containing protein [Bryobacteraceae bacterium]
MFRNKILIAMLAVFPLVSAGYAQAPQRARSATLRAAMERGYLGVGFIELTEDRVKALGLKNDNGVEVTSVGEKSPAAKSGLKIHDVILEVNGQTIEDADQFIRSIGISPAGSKVNLTIWREGAKRNVSATLESRPENPFLLLPDSTMPPMPPMPQSGPWDGSPPFSSLTGSGALVGFEGETLSPQLAAYFGVKDGVLVRTVGPKTPAERAGLKAGDVVTKVNGTPVASPREILGLVRARGAKLFSFTVVRNKKEISLNVEIAELRFPSFVNVQFDR